MSYTMKYADEKPKGDEEIVVQIAQQQQSLLPDNTNMMAAGGGLGAEEREEESLSKSTVATASANGGDVEVMSSDSTKKGRGQQSITAAAGVGGIAGAGSVGYNGKVMLFVDPMATLYIAGTVMDWEETELSSEFTFRNPNAKGECGCGESFNV